MAPPNYPNSTPKISSSLLNPIIDNGDEDDDFQDCPSSSSSSRKAFNSISISTTNTIRRPFKKPKKQQQQQKPTSNPGKESCFFDGGLDSIQPSLDFLNTTATGLVADCNNYNDDSIEAKSLSMGCEEEEERDIEEEFLEEGNTQLDALFNELCAGTDDEPGNDRDDLEEEGKGGISISCPLCGADISGLTDDLRQVHTNECLDRVDESSNVPTTGDDPGAQQCPGQVVNGSPLRSTNKVVGVSPVVEWLCNLGLAKYEEIFVSQEIDWETLQWLTEEDLCSIGITALGPRKKILHSLRELKNDPTRTVEQTSDVSKGVTDETKQGTTKLITDYFLGPVSERKRGFVATNAQNSFRKNQAESKRSNIKGKGLVRNRKEKNAPLWCCIPGTPFRVDAFKYLRRDFSHWFLTHFHLDHYQGLTKSFCHGKIYCSAITAKMVNLKIGISYDKIQILPLNQKINIAGIDVICFDANHCPGAIIILFEPPNGKPVLHTGDFRFGEEIAELSILKTCRIHTLILDTTYCNPQYDFPKQEVVIQFVIDAIQAEAFNPKTLFLIGSYSIGKERLFIEVARVLRKKVYVTAAKLRLLECQGLQREDMVWFTTNEQESRIHVVPMWTIASFKRLKQMSNQYMRRFSLIVAFSPTGWSFGKGKKSTGKRWQQGTIIRYEVPYSEHSSFTELKEFVKLVSPVEIIPSVNNHGPDSQNAMISQLMA